MPKIQLISPNESFEIGDAECAFVIRRIHQDVIREIRRRHTKRRETEDGGPAPVSGPQFPVLEVDESEVDRDILDYIIQDWRGVLGLDGADAACTRENKAALPGAVRNEIMMAAGAVNLEGASSSPLRPLKGPSAPGPAGASMSVTLNEKTDVRSELTAS